MFTALSTVRYFSYLTECLMAASLWLMFGYTAATTLYYFYIKATKGGNLGLKTTLKTTYDHQISHNTTS